MKDIEIRNDKNKFKYRVNGVLIYNNKVLALKMKNNNSYCLPGGHVKINENSQDALLREMYEETKIKVSIENELAIVENFYVGKKSWNIHELSFYFLVKAENINKLILKNYSISEFDGNTLKLHHFEWLDLSSLKDIDFRPVFIKNKLISGIYDFEHIIIKN